MKNLRSYSLICFLILVSLGVSSAQEKKSIREDVKNMDPDEMPQFPRFVVKTNPARYFWGPIPFTSEYRLKVESIASRYRSTEIGLSYLGESPILKTIVDSMNAQSNGNFLDIDIQVSGMRFQLAHKFYLFGIFKNWDVGMTLSNYSPNGYYIAPRFSAAYARFKVNDQPFAFVEMTHLNADLLIGRQMFFWGSMGLDAYVGVGYKNNIWEYREPSNHNANVISPQEMGPYAGKIRLAGGVNIGFYF